MHCIFNDQSWEEAKIRFFSSLAFSFTLVKLLQKSNVSASRNSFGGVLHYKRLMNMCDWMGSHFHDWIDYNGVVFSIDLLEWGRTS